MKLINLGSRVPQDVPNVRFRPALVDHLLELAAFLPVLANWIYILYRYREAGGELPSELYASGVTALIIFLLLGVTGYCPLRYINFPFRVGLHNVAYQCTLALRMIQGERDKEELQAEDDVRHPHQAQGQHVLVDYVVRLHPEGEIDATQGAIAASPQQQEEEQGRPARLIQIGRDVATGLAILI